MAIKKIFSNVRILLGVLLTSFMLSQSLQASTKVYQYNGDMPFIEMMLNMMVAMGMIDKIPPNFLANGNYYNNPTMANSYTNYPGFNAPDRRQGFNPNTMNRQSGSPPACVNESCGNNNPAKLNGVWVTQHGEMLAIKNQQFLWSDGRSNYLTGLIKTQRNVFSLKAKDNGTVVNYQYQLDNARFQTRDVNGVVRSFVRVPMNQGYQN